MTAEVPARVALPAMPHGVVIETGASGYTRCVDLPSGNNAANGERVRQWDRGAPNAQNNNQLFALEHTAGNWYRVSGTRAGCLVSCCSPLACSAAAVGP